MVDPTIGFDWEYILIENKKMKNAWCMPGGKNSSLYRNSRHNQK